MSSSDSADSTAALQHQEHQARRGTSSSQGLLQLVRSTLKRDAPVRPAANPLSENSANSSSPQAADSENAQNSSKSRDVELILCKAIELYREKNFPESLKYFNRILSKKENCQSPNSDSHLFASQVKASFYRACMIFHGSGVPKNVRQASEMFKQIWKDMKALPDSDDDKLFYLARMKDEGWGTRVNKREALLYYLKSTNRPGTDRNAIACFNMGLMYYLGEGVHKDYEKTRQMYAVAASMGHMSATYNLAVMYRDGVGGPKNTEEAMRLYHINAKRGDAKSMNSYALMIKPHNLQECIHWLKKAIEKGNPYACYNYAFILEEKQLRAEALQYYQLAARHGHVSAIESASILLREIRKTLCIGAT